MDPETGKKLKKARKKTETAAKTLRKQDGRDVFYEEKGKAPAERHFPDFHAALPDRITGGPVSAGKRSEMEEALRIELTDTSAELENDLQPEKRTGADLRTVRAKVTKLDRTLSKLAEAEGGLSPALQELQNNVRRKKRQLDRIAAKNIPMNPEALRSFGEVQAGIAADDAAAFLVSGMLESLTAAMNGQKASVPGMAMEDLEHVVNEIDAMGSRHRYTKEQQSLGLMEQESRGDIITRPNRVLQEASETKHGSQVRRETGAHGEDPELFENRKGEEERDALGKKHEIMKDLTRANRSLIRQKQEKDGLESIRGVMHNGERRMGFAPLAAMGLAGNLGKGFAGMDFMMSLTPAAVNRQMKRAEIQGITERYLGLDQLYRNFATKNSDIRNRTAFLKRYGMEGNVRVMIRKEQEKVLGLGSENRMHSFLMRKYARELWKGAFLKEDGSVITERERRAEAPEKKQRRKLYADMLRAMGIYVRYPAAEGELPGVSTAEIFRMMI